MKWMKPRWSSTDRSAAVPQTAVADQETVCLTPRELALVLSHADPPNILRAVGTWRLWWMENENVWLSVKLWTWDLILMTPCRFVAGILAKD
jgi:hypothetical protein